MTKEHEAEIGSCALKDMFIDAQLNWTHVFEVLASKVTYVLNKFMDDNNKMGILFYENNHYELDILLEDYLTKMKGTLSE